MKTFLLILAALSHPAGLRAGEPTPAPPAEVTAEEPAPEPREETYDPVKAIAGERESQLFQAARSGDEKRAALALAGGRVDPNVAEPQGGATPLQAAAMNGHLGLVRLLVGAGAAVNQTDREGRSALALATRGVHVAVMEYLLKNGAQVNLAAHDGTSPLHDAVLQNHFQMVELLVRHGACTTCGDARGLSPLDLAREARRPALVRAMGHDPEKGLFLRERMLRKAAQAGDEPEVSRLLKEGRLDVNFGDPEANDYTALHEAANFGHLPIVEQLVDHGADVNQPDRSGKAALYWAASLRHLSTMDYLLKHGAKVNQPNQDGQTALFLAVELRHPEMVELLLKKGANPRQKDKRGVSPLDYAKENGLTALVGLMDRYL